MWPHELESWFQYRGRVETNSTHVATPTVQKELPIYEVYFIIQANTAILSPLLEDKNERNRVLDMIVVGPVSNESHKVSSK